MSKQLSKFNNIQALRGIAALLVVFFHLHNFETLNGHGIIVLPKFFDIGCAGVDLFFVISGFIMASITCNEFQQPGAAFTFISNRITRIFPLYWFCTLLTIVLFWGRSFLLHVPLPHVDVLRSFLLIPLSGMPILPVGWTLIYEMYFYCVITFLLFFPEEMFVSLLVAWGIFILIAGLFKFTSPAMFTYTHPICFEFISGCLLARFIRAYPPRRIISLIILLAGIALFVLNFVGYRFYFPDALPQTWSRVAIFGLPAMLLLYGAVTLELHGRTFPRALCKLGDMSYSLYLLHYIIESGSAQLLKKISPDKPIYHIVLFIITLLIIFIGSALAYHYLEKPLIAYFRRASLAEQPVLEQ